MSREDRHRKTALRTRKGILETFSKQAVYKWPITASDIVDVDELIPPDLYRLIQIIITGRYD